MSKKHVCIAACCTILLLLACGAYLALSSFTQKENRYVLIYDTDTYNSLCSRLDTIASPLRMPVVRASSIASASGEGSASRASESMRVRCSRSRTRIFLRWIFGGLQ